VQWLGKHQEFSSNPFYVGGDSYSGLVVPATVQEISKGNCQCCNRPINLQGYVLGNPLTDCVYDCNYRVPFAHKMALISDELYEVYTMTFCFFSCPHNEKLFKNTMLFPVVEENLQRRICKCSST
jgi:serine carboxypeptidase-like clade 1